MGYDFVEDCIAQRNLVLMTSDAPVLDAPGGTPIGGTLKTCQTAFVIGMQDGYGEVFVMGGWIDLAHTVDVPENYGQTGSPVVSMCAGQ
jgi:hypothetical protein